jgi:hypothetical protein
VEPSNAALTHSKFSPDAEYKAKQTPFGKPRRRVRVIAALACAFRRVTFILGKTLSVMVNAWFAYWRMIFSEHRFPLFGIMRFTPQPSVNRR